MSDDRNDNAPHRGRRGYHHGDLKRALVGSARALIAEKGPMGFTMAEAARAAGVSPSAPYRHFADRDALLREVAIQGFEDFADRLERARSDPRLTPLQALDAQGRAYLAFAREEPAAFQTMFGGALDFSADPALAAAAERSFAALGRGVAAVLAGMPAERRPPAMMVATHIATISHGVAALNVLGARRAPMSAEEILESAVGVYLRGLGALSE